jgi:hypothetical protein
MHGKHCTFRLVTADEGLISKLDDEVKHLLEHHDRSEFEFKISPGRGEKFRGFTRHIYLHAKSDAAASLAKQTLSPDVLSSMTVKGG